MKSIIDVLLRLDHYHRYSQGEGLKIIVEKSARLLEERGVDFDTIAVQGVSGLLVGAPLAMVLGKDLLIIRKPGDKTRLHHLIPAGIGSNQKILLLDDCVQTGATLSNMLSNIKHYCHNPAFVGLFLYIQKHPKTRTVQCDGEVINVIAFGT